MLSAKEKLWDKIHTIYVDVIVSEPSGIFNNFLKILENLNPKKIPDALIISVFGIIILSLMVMLA